MKVQRQTNTWTTKKERHQTNRCTDKQKGNTEMKEQPNRRTVIKYTDMQ